jgi:hypothetical protein
MIFQTSILLEIFFVFILQKSVTHVSEHVLPTSPFQTLIEIEGSPNMGWISSCCDFIPLNSVLFPPVRRGCW